LFSLTRNSNNFVLKQYYKVYCKILKNVIKEAKRITYNKRILKSNNKSKTTWNIINELLGKQHLSNDIQKLTIEGSHLTNPHDIADAFNKYFSSIIDHHHHHVYYILVVTYIRGNIRISQIYISYKTTSPKGELGQIISP
jgi:hypothetical protein